MSFTLKYIKYKTKYNNLKNNSRTQKGGLNAEDAERLYKLYLRYYAKIVLTDNVYLVQSIQADYNRLNYFDDNNILGKNKLIGIKTEYSIDQIEKNFDKYGIIILRNVKYSSYLLLGCGNTPIMGYDPKIHDHVDYTTINPEITMNPTIIGALGYDDGIIQYMQDINDKFDVLCGEAVTLAADLKTANKIADALDKIMKPDYDVCELNHEYYGKGRDAFMRSYLVWIE